MKISLSILAIALILAGGYYWYTKSKPAPTAQTPQATTEQPAVVTGPTLSTGADTSDAALSQDVASVDTDMSAMAGDTSSIDSGLNDKAVPQN